MGINFACVFLSFAKFKKAYGCLCGCLHMRCLRIWVKIITRKRQIRQSKAINETNNKVIELSKVMTPTATATETRSGMDQTVELEVVRETSPRVLTQKWNDI